MVSLKVQRSGGGGFEYDTSLDGADSISLGSKLSASALIQANGGNDTIYIAGDILGSTAYGGQGADTISGAAAQSISGSLLAGNRGDDKIDFSSSTNSVFNTKVYGSDETGTLAGNDSIVLGAYTVQTSTVYGAGWILSSAIRLVMTPFRFSKLTSKLSLVTIPSPQVVLSFPPLSKLVKVIHFERHFGR